MMMIDYWDSQAKCQKARPATADEIAEINARKANKAIQDAMRHNAEILAKLEQIDRKSIRALREGDSQRIHALESEAAALRLQLVK
jgi:hypothetical protein